MDFYDGVISGERLCNPDNGNYQAVLGLVLDNSALHTSAHTPDMLGPGTPITFSRVSGRKTQPTPKGPIHRSTVCTPFSEPWTDDLYYHHHQQQDHDLANIQHRTNQGTDRADLSTARTATAGPNPNSAGKAPGKLGPSPQEKKASRPTHPTVLYLAVATLSSTNTTLAGVAQSVERVALINSKEINLKVVGSSPTFGYSYHTSSTEQLFFYSFSGGVGCMVWWWWLLFW